MDAANPFKLCVFGLIVALTTIGYENLASAEPRGYMRHMDDSMEHMMDQKGYGYGGYGRRGGYGHMMDPMGGMMGPMGYMMGNLAGLDLSDKQRDKIRDIHRSMRKRHFGLMEKMMNSSDKLYDLYDVEKPDAEKIGKVYDEIYKVKRQMIQEHIEIRNQIYDLLSKEQREKFKDNDPFAHRFGLMH